MSKNITGATARVTVTMEISVSDTWGPECSIEQVHNQAVQSAEGIMRKIVEKEPRIRVNSFKPVAVLVAKDPT